MQTQTKNERTGLRRYRVILLDEFGRRKGRNPAYSLRAFARDLGVSLTALSDAMANKRELSKANIGKVAESLGWSPESTAQILGEVEGRETEFSQKNFHPLEEDTFRLISEWYCMAILALANTVNAAASPKAIAERLGISPLEARGALERLQRLGLLDTKGGKLRQTTKALSVFGKAPSPAIRLFHKANLRLAEEALDRVPMELRDFGAITFPADPAKLGILQKELIAFRRRVAKRMDSENATAVYTLALQLFPVTRPSELEQ